MFFKKKKASQSKQPSKLGSDQHAAIVTFMQAELNIKDSLLLSCQNTQKGIEISLPVSNATQHKVLEQKLRSAGIIDSSTPIEFVQNIPIFDTPKPLITNIKNIIAVASGKGGVGKSSTAVNLAYALSKEGARVGILDADIYGPSVPIMLGMQDASPVSPDNKHMLPIEANGLVANSIGFLVKEAHASIWRGPMASKALMQLINETSWPLLDFLIVDLPPGTGDIQLTMAQQLPLTAAIVVTTPQDLAIADAAKGIAMFEKLDIPVLGLVENMSEFICPHCNQATPIFDTHGANALADRYDYPIFASIALDPLIRECADQGINLIQTHAESEIAQQFLQGARMMTTELTNKLSIHPVASSANTRIDITQLD